MRAFPSFRVWCVMSASGFCDLFLHGNFTPRVSASTGPDKAFPPFLFLTLSKLLRRKNLGNNLWNNLCLSGRMMDLRILLPALLLIFGLETVLAQSSAPDQVCEAKNGTSCEECLKNVSCLWCIKTKMCVTYPVRTILPPHALCPLNDARWGLCWMNFQILIITLAVVGGVLIIAFLVCLFCCCKCENFGSKRFEAKMQRQANKMKTKQEERRAEMKQRHEEIRKKYGLSGQNPYSRFA